MADLSTYAPASTTTTQGFIDAINGQLAQNKNPVDPNSDVVRSQTDAYRLSTERGLADAQKQAAEQAYATGNLNTGGAAQAQLSAREAASAAEAGNVGNVMATAEAQRQQNVKDLLGLGSSTSLQQQGVTNQAKQFGVTADQQQQAINNAFKIAQMQNDLGYYNTNTNANLTTRQQDISAAGGF